MSELNSRKDFFPLDVRNLGNGHGRHQTVSIFALFKLDKNKIAPNFFFYTLFGTIQTRFPLLLLQIWTDHRGQMVDDGVGTCETKTARPNVGNNSSLSFLRVAQKSAKVVHFQLKSAVFQKSSQKVINIWATFVKICCELLKIAQSGHTGRKQFWFLNKIEQVAAWA